MAQYLTTGETIEAVQWDGTKISEITPWMSKAIEQSPIHGQAGWAFWVKDDIHLGSHHEVLIAKPGDFIINAGFKGLYPLKPEIFHLLFTKAIV